MTHCMMMRATLFIEYCLVDPLMLEGQETNGAFTNFEC